MKQFEARLAELVRAEQQRRIARVASSLRAMLHGAHIETDGDRVVVGGRGILQRWLTDPALRFIGEGAR